MGGSVAPSGPSVQETLQALCDAVRELQVEVGTLKGAQQGGPISSSSRVVVGTSGSEVNLRLAPPDKFSGDPARYQEFINQCRLQFRCQPMTYAADRAKVAFILSHCTGTAAIWAAPLISQTSPVLDDYGDFMRAFKEMFQSPTHLQASQEDLFRCRQGAGTVVSYAAHFQQLAANTDSTGSTLLTLFRKGLQESIKDELLHSPPPDSLRNLVQQALLIEARLQERRRERRPLPRDDSRPPSLPAPVGGSNMGTEPMQIGLIKGSLTEAERQRRRMEGRCFYCGGKGHILRNCSRRGKQAENDGDLH